MRGISRQTHPPFTRGALEVHSVHRQHLRWRGVPDRRCEMNVTLIVFAVAILGMGTLFYLVRRRPSDSAAYHAFRCPGCGQKVRYLATKAGRPAKCPRCRGLWTLPTNPQLVTTGGYSLRRK